MIHFTTSQTVDDLKGILVLQQQNLRGSLTSQEILDEGFVTVAHSLEVLKKMNNIEHNIIVKEAEKIIGYLIAMTSSSRNEIPILQPMFEMLDKIVYKGKVISDYNYLVVGQACVDKHYRGQGILDKAYQEYRNHFQNKYELAITEIASKNMRSMRAHHRVGFTTIHEYFAPNGEGWHVVVWDWH